MVYMGHRSGTVPLPLILSLVRYLHYIDINTLQKKHPGNEVLYVA